MNTLPDLPAKQWLNKAPQITMLFWIISRSPQSA